MPAERVRARAGRFLEAASAFEQIDVLEVHGLAVAEDRDDDREADRRFGGGDRHHEARRRPGPSMP